MSKRDRKSLFARLVDWVWRNPKANISEGIKKTCDDMPPEQRLMVVLVLLSAFVLVAFFVFGHACYKIGARQAYNEIEVEHLKTSSYLQVLTSTSKNTKRMSNTR